MLWALALTASRICGWPPAKPPFPDWSVPLTYIDPPLVKSLVLPGFCQDVALARRIPSSGEEPKMPLSVVYPLTRSTMKTVCVVVAMLAKSAAVVPLKLTVPRPLMVPAEPAAR